MAEPKNEAGALNWHPVLVAAVIAFVVSIVIGICPIDMGFFLNIFIVAPALVLMSVALPLYAVVRNRSGLPTIAVTLAVLWAIPVSVFLYNRAHPFELRATARWLVWSQEYKREVLTQAPSANGNLKHIEWDGSGFVGVANNTLYLVFDPADILAATAHQDKLGKTEGLPCDVRFIHRFEAHWYAVLFYTDETWEFCSSRFAVLARAVVSAFSAVNTGDRLPLLLTNATRLYQADLADRRASAILN